MKKVYRCTGGHIQDIDPAEIADQFYTRAHNVHTRKGFASRINGRRIAYPVLLGQLPTDPYHLLNISLNTLNWWIVFGADDIFGVQGTSFSDISLAGQLAVTNPYEWNTTILNTIPVANNGSNAPMYWDGFPSSHFLPLPGWPVGTVCKYIVAFRYHLFALNIDGAFGTFENQVLHSDAAEPGTLPASWTAAPDNEAGDFTLSDTPGPCICGVTLNNQLLIYKQTSMFAVEYAGQQPDNIFSQRTISRSFGAMGPHCVVDLGNRHFVVGNDDIVLSDGINFQSIADNRIKRTLANTVDETFVKNTFVVRDINQRETWVCVPEAGNQFCTVAHIWDERRDTWVTRDLNFARHGAIGYVTDADASEAWDADTQVWDEDLSTWNEANIGAITRMVLAEPNVMQVEDTNDPVLRVADIQKVDLAFDDDGQHKLIQRVWIRGTGSGFPFLQFRLGARNTTDESITWQTFVDIESEGTPVEISGRYISITIRSTDDQPATVDKITFEGRYNGAY